MPGRMARQRRPRPATAPWTSPIPAIWSSGLHGGNASRRGRAGCDYSISPACPLISLALARAARGGADGPAVAAPAFDEGRALHHLLGEAFGPGALQPFRLVVAPRARSRDPLGLTRRPTPIALRETAAPVALSRGG